MQEEITASGGTRFAKARIKVLNPLTSLGPSMEAQLLKFSDSDVQLRTPRRIEQGSTVQVRTSRGVVFGKVWLSMPVGEGSEIDVAISELMKA